MCCFKRKVSAYKRFRDSKAGCLFDLGFFWNRQSRAGGGEGHEGPHHNFVVIAPIIMKFGTAINLDVFYTMVTKSL